MSLGSPGCDIAQVIMNLQIMFVLYQPTNSLVVVVVSLNEALHSFKYRWCDKHSTHSSTGGVTTHDNGLIHVCVHWTEEFTNSRQFGNLLQ